MRRIRILTLTAFALLTVLAVAPNAIAGDFADDPCSDVSGDNYTCPSATVGASYALDIKLKEPWPGCTNMVVSSGSLPPGLSLSSEGNITGTPTTAGSYPFYITVSWSNTAPCITQPSSDRKFTINVSGPVQRLIVSSGSLPPGLSLSSEGNITGTPTTAGSYPFYITVSWSNTAPCITQPSSDRKFTINVSGPVQRLIVSTSGLPDANIGQAYSAPALAASGGTVSSWSLAGGTLPAGLTLASNGVISGTPTQSGAFSFTVQANGSPNNDTKQLSIFVVAPLELQTLTGAKPPTTGLTAKAAVSAALTTGVKAVGGRAPYAFSAEGALPPGITLNPTTGALTGTGTTAGRYSSTVTVTDAAGAKSSVTWSFTILPLLDFAKGKGLPTGKVGRIYSARIPVSGKDAKAAQFAVSGQIPPGLELDDTGRLTGTLLKAGNYRVRVFAFSTSGAPISKIFRIKVSA